MEPEGTSGEESDAGIERFDERVGEAVVQGVEDRVQVLINEACHLDKGLETRADCPFEPLLQEVSSFLKGELEDESKVLLQKVAPIERLEIGRAHV